MDLPAGSLANAEAPAANVSTELTHDVDLLRYSLTRAVAGNLKRGKLRPAAASVI
jgi:hypothetical protein